VKQRLEELLLANGNGYVFSEDGGKTPIPVEYIHRQFDRALEKIGISREEKLRRHLSFHAWRHFFNTFLRLRNVPDSKVQPVIGHLTKKMTEHYTHFDTREFTEVRNVQAELLEIMAPQEAAALQEATAPQEAGILSVNPEEKATAQDAELLAIETPVIATEEQNETEASA
jgi:site-specific recombinase XerC